MNSPEISLPHRSGTVLVVAGLAVLAWVAYLQQGAGQTDASQLCRWYAATLGLALILSGRCVQLGAATFGLLAFLFVLGGAAQLYLTEPLRFPTLRLHPEGAGQLGMVMIIALEAVVAVAVLVRTGLDEVMREAQRRLGIGRLAVLMVISAFFAVPASQYVLSGAAPEYAAHVVAGGILIAIHVVTLVAMARVQSPISGAHRIAPIVPATFAVLTSLALGYFAFENMPHIEDEVAFLFQARTYGSGALWVPAPPEAVRSGLEYYMIEMQDGRWYSAMPPGWPAILAPALLLGMSWLVNPLLAGVTVLLAHAISMRKAGRDAADLVALMVGSSPWLIAAAASLMPHTLALTLTLFAWWMILRSQDDVRRAGRRLLLAGLAMGWVFATRPLDGLVVGVLTGLWLVVGGGASLRRVFIYAAGCVGTGSLHLAYNAYFTGNPLSTPIGRYLDRVWGPGAGNADFRPEISTRADWAGNDLWTGHSFSDALVNVANLLASLQFELLGWSVGSLVLVLVFLIWQKPNRFDKAMLLVVMAVIGAMFLYWFAESYHFGPRYWFLAAFPLFFLSARGYEALRERFPGQHDLSFIRIDSVLWACCLFGLFVFTPWRGVAKFHEYGNFHSSFRDAAATGEMDNSVVIFDRTGNPGSAFMLNRPRLDGTTPIFVLNTGKISDEAVAAAFPGRRIIHFSPDWAPE